MRTLITALLAFSFVSLAQAQKDTDVLATVGSKKITYGEFNKKFKEASAQIFANPPTKAAFLEDLIRYEIGIQEAKKRGLEKDPIVQDQMNQALYKGLLEKELGQKVQETKVTEEEMKAWYSKNPQIRVSTILIEVKPGATDAQRDEAKKRATEILAEVKTSKRPFEELVRLYSDDTITKSLGGDVGWQSRITLHPAYYEAASKLKINEVTPQLVEVPFGFHIIKLTGKRTYEEAPKREIRIAVFDEKRKVLFDQYFDKLRKGYSVNVNGKF